MAVFKNERGTWNCKFYYTDWTGTRKQKKKEGFKTKKEAQTFEADFLNSCKTDIGITFENLVTNYMQDCKARLKPTTYENKKLLIYTKLIPYLGKMLIKDISAATVRKWQNKIITDKRNYAPTYQKAIHNQLSAILNYAVKYYGLTANNAAKCGSIGKKNADTMLFWTYEEFSQFIKAVEDRPMSKVIFNLLFFSGMREGEMLALTLNDFNFEKNTVKISKNYAKVNGEELIQEPKTPKSKREISLPKKILDMIKTYSETLYDYKPNERLFLTSKYSLKRQMVYGCKKSGVKQIRIHDIRHSHASMLIEKGIAPLAISERLGHEDIQTTLNVYSHLYPNKQAEIAEMLSDYVN